ncbi:MAG: GNAT family N-acetyltransferase [Chloroflexi bacterium]|nr:GNAT family N-acetyltransferase [Chloroflexota bacterium]
MRIVLRTERLILRQFTTDDADALIALDSDPAVLRFINGGEPIAARVTREQTLPRYLDWHRRSDDWGYWAAIDIASGRFLGWFHLRPPGDDVPPVGRTMALGYRLRGDAWGHGYATEGSRALMRYGFDRPTVERIVAMALVDNVASVRVMERAGLRFVRDFTYTGPDPAAWYVGRPAVEYGLTRAEFQAAGPTAGGRQ